ncbi:restriction endonuclease subunit S [Metamycoplasma equirhinis]|uniref:restriction endonuclease subunit S n=1 Tax=Metamycoplasma equirhinis TaxID=92402 RepID=UPI00359331E1
MQFAFGAQYKKLEELGEFFTGLKNKTKKDFQNGNSKYISYLNVFNNLKINVSENKLVYVSELEKQNELKYADVLFTNSSETKNESAFSSVVCDKLNDKYYLNSFCFIFRFNDTSKINPIFISHLFRSRQLRKQLINTVNGVTRFNVSKEKMKKIIIPIVPLEEQNRIANILEKFEKLCNDSEQGLLAEINLRQKQYEYYRDKLLTFNKSK